MTITHGNPSHALETYNLNNSYPPIAWFVVPSAVRGRHAHLQNHEVFNYVTEILRLLTRIALTQDLLELWPGHRDQIMKPPWSLELVYTLAWHLDELRISARCERISRFQVGHASFKKHISRPCHNRVARVLHSNAVLAIDWSQYSFSMLMEYLMMIFIVEVYNCDTLSHLCHLINEQEVCVFTMSTWHIWLGWWQAAGVILLSIAAFGLKNLDQVGSCQLLFIVQLHLDFQTWSWVVR